MSIRSVPLGESYPSTTEPLNIITPGLWFWIKAGIGFTLGSGIAAIIGFMLWLGAAGLIGLGFLAGRS